MYNTSNIPNPLLQKQVKFILTRLGVIVANDITLPVLTINNLINALSSDEKFVLFNYLYPNRVGVYRNDTGTIIENIGPLVSMLSTIEYAQIILDRKALILA